MTDEPGYLMWVIGGLASAGGALAAYLNNRLNAGTLDRAAIRLTISEDKNLVMGRIAAVEKEASDKFATKTELVENLSRVYEAVDDLSTKVENGMMNMNNRMDNKFTELTNLIVGVIQGKS